MIRFRFPGSSKHREPIAFVGLSDENLTRLRAGQPIRVKASDPLGLAIELVIYHGATEVEMAAELEENGFMPPGSTDKTREAMAERGEFRTPAIGYEACWARQERGIDPPGRERHCRKPKDHDGPHAYI